MSAARRDRYATAASGTARKRETEKPPRTDPIRVTLDLSPGQHRALKRWCNQAAADHDLPTVALARVLRLLGEELVKDDDLADTIAKRLKEMAIEDAM
ncbi:hypothetical protein AB0N09_41535 [Streptomyces erythrochromogenes]|uniref:hypothetical protein n=1 Tax=Streptomyces erythrochromogenes TaxID=285574 RepID=UPI0034162651